ncbi:hypothetical protein [Vulcanococcus sp.]|uniref:hypothetical protein n=1 Tax=Vulcanococcus sp. TaxID=2856995 RepID=UPI003F69BA06
MGFLPHWLGWSRQDQGQPSPVLRFSEQLPLPPTATGVGDVQPPTSPPALDFTPWTIARLDAIGREVVERPCQASLQAAQSARGCLSRFWLAAPVDGLETFFNGAIGDVYRHLLAGALPALPLDRPDVALKQQLTDFLQQGLERHGSINVLLALLPYLDREAMQVHEPLRYIPAWLIPLYAERCEPGLGAQSTPQRPQLPPMATHNITLPELAPITGTASMALIGDAEFLGRINGLISLYNLEPGDPEICRDLSQGRRQVAQIWLDVDSDQLEALYQTPFGQLTDHLITSRFAVEPLSQDELAMRQQLSEVAADLRHPRALNALLAALLYYPIEQVTLPADSTLIPAWLSESLTRQGVQPAGRA